MTYERAIRCIEEELLPAMDSMIQRKIEAAKRRIADESREAQSWL